MITFLIFAWSCDKPKNHLGEIKSNGNSVSENRQASLENEDRDSLLLSLTQQVLTIIKEGDYDRLAGFIHPTSGVRFSPYGYIDTTDHVKVNPDQFLQLLDRNKLVNWGNYDGTGKEILLTPEGYFDRFVYDADFYHAEQTVVNEVLGKGNTLNNLENIYKGANFTESYFSGFKEKYAGMDWRSLRLVYQPYQGKLFLVAVVHDEWTI